MASRLKQVAGSTNPILSQFAIGYKNGRLIGDSVVPNVEVLTITGTFYKMGKEGFLLYNTTRPLRADAKKILSALETDTYACVENALEHPVDYSELEVAERYGVGKVLSLKKRAGMIVSMALAVAREKAKADLLFGATNYASGNKVTLTGTDQWSDKNNSTPMDDIYTGIKAARADMGIEPNTITFGYLSWDAFRNHPNVIAKIKTTKNAFVTIEDAKEILGVKNIFVGEAVYSTDLGVFTDLWGDNVALHYLPVEGELPEGVPMHSVGMNLIGYPEVREYPMKKTIDIEETQKYDDKNISTSNGYLIIDTVS